MDLINYGLRERYEQLKKRGDKLAEIKNVIDWESLRPLLNDLFTNDTDQGGRPNYDEILMVKILFLQAIYNIVDESMETEIYDSVRFINFLDYPESVPDQNTIWLFRERLSKTGKDKALWKDIWRQFKEKGITVRNGTIQDATFITSDPGHRRKDRPDVIDPQSIPPLRDEGMDDPSDKDKQARKVLRMEERPNAKTRKSNDGS
jgi:IS5 family transposase